MNQHMTSEDSLVDTGSGTENETGNTTVSVSELEETTRSRRPLKNPVLWKQNMRKRNAGDEYTSCKEEKVKRRRINRKIAHADSNAFKKLKKKISKKYLNSIGV